ncbi:MAG: TlpA family protein disulfide reductase [Thermoleophilaceae bacterium]|nr:TlpA family protein disulfide reductase [Thermoleophilaceae bacterium]
MESKRSPWTYVVFAGVAALLALLIYGVAIKSGGNKFDNALAAGERLPAPTRQVRVLNDTGTKSIEDFRGKVILLNFWASWCEPCKAESPAIERAYAKYAKDGLIVLGADVDDLSKDANQFIIENKLTYPIIRYSSANATKDFGTKRMPETFVIDREGNVAALQRFQVDDEWLNTVLPPILAERPAGSS